MAVRKTAAGLRLKRWFKEDWRTPRGKKDYRGGEVEFINSAGERYFAPKQKGTLIVFDSRTKHRVRTVKSGLRKSLVGWVVGPRWK